MKSDFFFDKWSKRISEKQNGSYYWIPPLQIAIAIIIIILPRIGTRNLIYPLFQYFTNIHPHVYILFTLLSLLQSFDISLCDVRVRYLRYLSGSSCSFVILTDKSGCTVYKTLHIKAKAHYDKYRMQVKFANVSQL